MTQECDFTLIVASTAWRERWEGRNEPHEGAGAAREADALHGMFDENQRVFRERVLIVTLPGVTQRGIPADLYGIVRFEVNPRVGDSMEPLLRHLLGEPEFVLPKLGSRPAFLPQQRVTSETQAGEPVTRLSGEAGRAEGVTELKQAAQEAAPPPELGRGNSVEDWMTALAAWNDDTAELVDDIELTTALTSRDPSARFVQQRDKVRESIKAVIAGMRGPRTAEHATELSETAARLRGQVARLARLAQEP
jgi:hypothetical protein